jgi:hypothetical protein
VANAPIVVVGFRVGALVVGAEVPVGAVVVGGPPCVTVDVGVGLAADSALT